MSEKSKLFFIYWSVLLVLNQFILFHGCFKFYCILAALPHTAIIAYIYTSFIWKPKKEENKPHTKPIHNTPRKQKGDAYEKFIGKKLEDKGEFVIYNGLIRGYEDRGVDIISLQTEEKVVNLIQCKNWTNMKMELEHIKEIYQKLHAYTLDVETLDYESISTHMENKKSKDEVLKTVSNAIHYPTIRKTLYIATENVINPKIGEHLKMIKPSIFRYEDMKIVFVRLGNG